MKLYSFWIDESVVVTIKKLVKTMGMNVSTFFRLAIIEKMEKEIEKRKQ